MNLVLELTIKIFVIMAIGFAAKKMGLIDEGCKQKLSGLLVNLLLPVSMVVSSQQPFGVEHLKGAGQIALISFLYYMVAFACGLGIGKLVKMETKKTAMFTMLIAFANTGFVGMPLLGQIIGETGTLYGAIYNSVFDVLYFSYGIYLISGDGREKIDWKALFGNPMIWVAFITIFFYVMPFRFPAVLTDSLGLVGNCMMPVSMLIIGAEIAGMDRKSVLSDKASYGVSAIRMFLFPLITFGIMKILDAEYEVAATAVILSAMPSGSLNVIMGQKYENNARFAATAVMQNTVLMVITLPVFAYLCERYLH